MSPVDATARNQAGAVIAKEIRKGEGEVARILSEAGIDRGQHIGFDNGAAEAGRQRAQKSQAPLADDSFGFFGDDAEHAHDAAVVAAERAVGEGMVGLFAVAAAFEEEKQRLVPCGLASIEDALDARTDVGPDFTPDLARGFAQSPGMLLAQGHASISVVVEEGQIGSPAHPHRIARGEQDANHSFEALRPGVHGTERRLRPVAAVHEVTDLATGKQVPIVRGSRRRPPRRAPLSSGEVYHRLGKGARFS